MLASYLVFASFGVYKVEQKLAPRFRASRGFLEEAVDSFFEVLKGVDWLYLIRRHFLMT